MQARTTKHPTDPELEVFDYAKLEANGYGSRTTIWRKVRAGTFPQPTYIGERPFWTRQQLADLHEK
jgi:hypothetical protein